MMVLGRQNLLLKADNLQPITDNLNENECNEKLYREK